VVEEAPQSREFRCPFDLLINLKVSGVRSQVSGLRKTVALKFGLTLVFPET